MPMRFDFLWGLLDDDKRYQRSRSYFSTNKNRLFQDSPQESLEEDKVKTRLIDEYCVSVCLVLFRPGSPVDTTIYNRVIGYPPPEGVRKSDVKRWILEATIPIPIKDYIDLIKNRTLSDKLVHGDDYTKIVQVIESGSVYTPVNNAGVPVSTLSYSSIKGWYSHE